MKKTLQLFINPHFMEVICSCVSENVSFWREGGSKTGSPVDRGDTSLISASAWPSHCSGVLIYRLPRPMRWGSCGMALSTASDYLSGTLGRKISPPLHLVISTWLAYIAQSVSMTDECASTSERQLLVCLFWSTHSASASTKTHTRVKWELSAGCCMNGKGLVCTC